MVLGRRQHVVDQDETRWGDPAGPGPLTSWRESAERVCGVIIDRMQAICGIRMTDASTGALPIYCKYDPDYQNTVAYAKQYESTDSVITSKNCSTVLSWWKLSDLHNVSAPNDAELDRSRSEYRSHQSCVFFSKHYHLGSSETLHEMVFHDGGSYPPKISRMAHHLLICEIH